MWMIEWVPSNVAVGAWRLICAMANKSMLAPQGVLTIQSTSPRGYSVQDGRVHVNGKGGAALPGSPRCAAPGT